MAEHIITPGITVTNPPVPDEHGWLPIETAPKDGTVIMLWINYGHQLGFWNGRSWDDRDFFDNLGDPSHWQPLPLPPVSPRSVQP